MSRNSRSTGNRQRKADFARPCIVCGTPTFYSHCEQHIPVAKRKDLERRLKHESTVNRLRPKVLKRDKYTCQQCAKQDKTAKTLEIDHLQAFANGGEATPENLRVLCIPCHRAKTRREAKGFQEHPNPMKRR